MMFVDGENLAIRYKHELGEGTPGAHVLHVPDVLVWARQASRLGDNQVWVRRYYYTSARGDADARDGYAEKLNQIGIEAPRVFPRKTNGRSKRVDITLATEMLTHAHRGNFDIAVLVAGDEDYVPLVEAVKSEGRRVAIWFLASGLSPALRRSADYFWNIGDLLFANPDTPTFQVLYDVSSPKSVYDSRNVLARVRTTRPEATYRARTFISTCPRLFP
jgi:hypothetical protein